LAGIAVISNKNARRNRRHPVFCEEIRSLLGADGVHLETTAVSDIPRAIESCIERDVEILAVNGGDGTLHATVTDLVRLYRKAGKELPLVALLRGGTMNTISKSMKTLAGTPLSILGHVVGKYRRGERFLVSERHTLDLNDGAEMGFIFGLGLAPNFLKAYYEGGRTGPVKGAYVLTRLVLSTFVSGGYSRKIFNRIPGFVAGDGREAPYESYTCVLAATVTEIGLGFSPLARTLDRENHFQIVAGAISPLSYAWQVGRIYSGAPLRGAVFDEVVGEARIDLHEDADYMIDGDIKNGVRSFKLKAGPRIRFIQY